MKLRLLIYIILFIGMIAAAGAGVYFVLKGIDWDKVDIPFIKKGDETNYNFPIPKVAGVTEIVNYEYQLFNIPVDYNVYKPFARQSMKPSTEIELDDTKKVVIPVLGYSQSIKNFEIESQGTKVTLVCTNNCPSANDLTTNDIVVFIAKSNYYAKLTEVYQKNGETLMSLIWL